MKKRTKIDIRLPKEQIKTLKKLSKLSGVSVDDVCNVVLASFVMHNKK